MINVTNLLQYLSMVSFIDILVTNNQNTYHNRYGTVMIYLTPSDPSVRDVSDLIVQTLSS